MQISALLSALAVLSVARAQDAPWCRKYSADTSTEMSTIVIPNDGSADVSGYDAAGNCGGGFRDNLNGRGATLLHYECNYGPDDSACVKMHTITWGNDDIGAAYDASTGGLQIGCENIGNPGADGYIPCPWE
ncbi:hypothetical protein GQ53DRAFT_773526 [Thozetella sp. PMI_491]|nr:hypothetical protein GQ53DRAFT_773526 [Thozetella sp. PMI_491]